MRKIKFRGKTENGRWAFGYLFKSNGKTFIMENDNASVQVKEETVGQLISETLNKNNVEVYEGDFVQTNYSDSYSPTIAAIIYGGKYGITGFGLAFKEDFSDSFIWDILNSKEISVIKKVGNIYDNPELWNRSTWKIIDKKDIVVLNEDDGEID